MAVVVVYNAPSVDELLLTRSLLRRILTGRVVSWCEAQTSKHRHASASAARHVDGLTLSALVPCLVCSAAGVSNWQPEPSPAHWQAVNVEIRETKYKRLSDAACKDPTERDRTSVKCLTTSHLSAEF